MTQYLPDDDLTAYTGRVGGFRAVEMRRLRKSHDWDYDALSRRTGIPGSTLLKYETGARSPRPERLQILAWALGTLPSKLADEPGCNEVPSRLGQILQRFVDDPPPGWRDDMLWLLAHIQGLHRLTALPVQPLPAPSRPALARIPTRRNGVA